MIKLIAIDLDGTLLTSDKVISDETKKAIRQADEAGLYVVLCTGRPIMGIQGFLDELGLVSDKHYCVTFNGGLVQVTGTQAILAQKVHTLEDVQMIYEACYQAGLPVNAIDLEKVYEPDYPEDNPSYYPTIIKNLQFEKRSFETFEATHVFNKALTCCPESVLNERLKQLPQVITERYNLLRSRPVLVEILPKDVDKAFGLRQLCEHLGVQSSEVMTIGDEENDLAMITFAGVGVAMGNATDEVKSVADVITDTNDRDGVAKAIYQYAL